MSKSSKANKKVTKIVIGATPVDTKKKKTKRGSGDSRDTKKWNLPLRRINPEATWGSFFRGRKDSFLDENNEILKYRENDVRFNWGEMAKQVERLVEDNKRFEKDPESNNFLKFILRNMLHNRYYPDHQKPVREECEDLYIRDNSLIVVKVANPQEKVFTPYHVHYLVNIVTAYVSKTKTDDELVFSPAGKISRTLDKLGLF